MQSSHGADCYAAYMFLESMLPQKWFGIPFDPELESQIQPVILNEGSGSLSQEEISLSHEIRQMANNTFGIPELECLVNNSVRVGTGGH